MENLVPCSVVVDSRNMRGAANRMFGWPQNVSVEGVRDAMRLYGLEAVSVHVGVATRSIGSSPSRQLKHALERNGEYRDQLVADGAEVLEGVLVERQSRMEEKQVDVLCAVRVCDLADRILTKTHSAKLIVVLSEDMDLMPAYDFAKMRGVTAYAAANDSVHLRKQQKDWLLLDEAALRGLVAPAGRFTGSGLRAELAQMALSTDAPTSRRWTMYGDHGGGSRSYRMRGNIGAAGVWVPGRPLQYREKADLFAVGLAVDSEEGDRFPHLLLSEDVPQPGPMPGVERARVEWWQTPTTVKVSVGETQATVRATPGSVLPGQEVAVLTSTSSRGRATHLVGALSQPPAVDGWTSSAHRAFVTVTGEPISSGAWIPGSVEGCEDEVLIHAKHLTHAERGTRLSAFLSGVMQDHALPTVMPLTCCLPWP